MSEAMSRGITAVVYWSSSGARQSRCLHTCYYSDEGQRPEVEDGKPNHRFGAREWASSTAYWGHTLPRNPFPTGLGHAGRTVAN